MHLRHDLLRRRMRGAWQEGRAGVAWMRGLGCCTSLRLDALLCHSTCSHCSDAATCRPSQTAAALLGLQDKYAEGRCGSCTPCTNACCDKNTLAGDVCVVGCACWECWLGRPLAVCATLRCFWLNQMTFQDKDARWATSPWLSTNRWHLFALAEQRLTVQQQQVLLPQPGHYRQRLHGAWLRLLC